MASSEGRNTGHRSGDGETGEDAQDAAGPNPMSGSRTTEAWENAAAVIPGLTTLVSAWIGYPSATTARVKAIIQSNLANRPVTIDVTTFAAWLTAELASDERRSSRSLQARFRPDFIPASEAWHAGTPAGRPPPGSSFVSPEHVLPSTVEADRVLRVSDSEAGRADTARAIGDNLVLVAVLNHSGLFHEGKSTKIASPRSAHAAVTLAAVIFVAAMAVFLFITHMTIGT